MKMLPKDVMSFVRYLKREQYGSRPLLYGPYFTANLINYKEGEAVYTKGKDKYEITEHKPVTNTISTPFFPAHGVPNTRRLTKT
ncbi:MAG: hypothetical protein WDO14_03800 [Bacteroidota bacterium]